MTINYQLGEEIKDYIKNVLEKETMVLDVDHICVAASNSDNIGKKFDLDIDEKNSCSIKKINGNNQAVVVLKHLNEPTAYLIINDTDKAVEYVPLLKSFAELLINQYFENNKPILDSTDQFVTKLLDNAKENDLPFYQSEAKVLGYDLDSKRIGIIVHLKGFWEDCLLSINQLSFERDEVIKNTKRKIEAAINGFFSKNNDIVIAYLGNDKFVVFKAVDDMDEENIRKFLSRSFKSIFEPLKGFKIHSVSVGYGNAYRGIAGIITAYREAVLALELGQKLWGDNRSYYFGDLGILSLLGEGDREKNLKFANKMLGRMKNQDLNKTLEVFFDENLNLTETAEKMGVHRNTVIYRLNQISKILGADPRIFEQAMSIKIALLIKRLFA
jgi:carbohydrate diacid regulator